MSNFHKVIMLNQRGFDHAFVAVACFVLVGVVGSLLAVASHALTTAFNGELEAFSDNSGYCLTDNGTKNGSKVILSLCTSSNAAQIWTRNDVKAASVMGVANVQEFMLQSSAGMTECLNNPYGSKTKGTALQLFTCHSNDNNSLWVWGSSLKGTNLSSNQLVNVGSISGTSRLCLDDAYGAKTNGNKVQLYTCSTSGPPNQRWFPDGSSGGTASGSEHIMTALYADPGTSAWTQVENAAPIVKYSIVNICAPDGTGSGCGKPADEKNSSWTSTIAALKSKGITPLYYISTNYGAVSLSTVESEIRNAITWYGVANPMFDTMADSGNCSNGGSPLPCTTYYQDLYNYTVNAGASTVVYNPGTITPSNYVFGTKEILMVFEGTASDFENTTFPTWMSKYPSSQFTATVYAGSSSTIGNDVNHAVKSHIGNFYEVDEAQPPNYSTLPSFWTTEVRDVKAAQ